MSYIITATFPINDAMVKPTALLELLETPGIRLLREDKENDTVTLDIRGDLDKRGELTRAFVNQLLDAGVLRFEIGHSY